MVSLQVVPLQLPVGGPFCNTLMMLSPNGWEPPSPDVLPPVPPPGPDVVLLPPPDVVEVDPEVFAVVELDLVAVDLAVAVLVVCAGAADEAGPPRLFTLSSLSSCA